jgi:hypothetical protein
MRRTWLGGSLLSLVLGLGCQGPIDASLPPLTADEYAQLSLGLAPADGSTAVGASTGVGAACVTLAGPRRMLRRIDRIDLAGRARLVRFDGTAVDATFAVFSSDELPVEPPQSRAAGGGELLGSLQACAPLRAALLDGERDLELVFAPYDGLAGGALKANASGDVSARFSLVSLPSVVEARAVLGADGIVARLTFSEPILRAGLGQLVEGTSDAGACALEGDVASSEERVTELRLRCPDGAKLVTVRVLAGSGLYVSEGATRREAPFTLSLPVP